MKTSLKIILISAISLLIIGLIIFCVGASLGTNNSIFMQVMWAGFIIFLIGVGGFIVFFFYRAFLKRKYGEENDIKRG